MQAYSLPVTNRLSGALKQTEFALETPRGPVDTLCAEDITPGQPIGRNPRDAHSDPLSGPGRLDTGSVHLHAADPAFAT